MNINNINNKTENNNNNIKKITKNITNSLDYNLINVKDKLNKIIKTKVIKNKFKKKKKKNDSEEEFTRKNKKLKDYYFDINKVENNLNTSKVNYALKNNNIKEFKPKLKILDEENFSENSIDIVNKQTIRLSSEIKDSFINEFNLYDDKSIFKFDIKENNNWDIDDDEDDDSKSQNITIVNGRKHCLDQLLKLIKTFE